METSQAHRASDDEPFLCHFNLHPFKEQNDSTLLPEESANMR